MSATEETGYVLYDPVAERFMGEGSMPRVYATAAKVFRTREAAEKQLAWWRNNRYSELRSIHTVTETVGPTD